MKGFQAPPVCPSGTSNTKMSIEHWWNGSDGVKSKYSKRNLL